jgi:tRNA pseudouridine32 synthase/23S rRNA pseudouridine746 synthase
MTGKGKFTSKKTVGPEDLLEACAFLAQHTGLSKARIKDAMNKGAVWIQRKGRARERLRRTTAVLREGEVLELFYDPKLLSIDPPQARCVMDRGSYSIWFKPAGLLAQGTDFGDHCSVLRQVEIAFTPRRQAFPVHRLDREVEGLVLVAHTRQAARELSKIFQGRKVRKRYRAEVLGLLEQATGTIDHPLDGKPAMTRYLVLSHDPHTNTSILLVEIESGRLHQIRRHLAAIGHPIMGDPRYCKDNKDGYPMRLVAFEIEFRCPISRKEIKCRMDDPLEG